MKMGTVEKTFVNSAGHSRRAAWHAEQLLARIDYESGQEYLDVGCGNGAAPIHLARQFGLRVTGIDVDRQQIAAAQRAATGIAGVVFRSVDGTALPFDDGRFHIVAARNVLHHIPPWTTALAEMVRVLRPGGYLLYTDVVLPGWAAFLGRWFGGSPEGLPSVRAIDRVLERSGLLRLHVARAFVHYEVICRKAAPAETAAPV